MTMKIDEAIEVMKNAFIECVENHTELNVVDANVDIQNALKELQWYRDQDLIRREDVKNDEVLKEIALGFEREFLKTVMMIPKAEYRGDNNGD